MAANSVPICAAPAGVVYRRNYPSVVGPRLLFPVDDVHTHIHSRLLETVYTRS